MPISYSEPMSLACPRCTTLLHAEVWLILDAQENPAQVDALCQNTMNVLTCSQCAYRFVAPTAFLFHDRATRMVLFAPAPATEEYIWREQARELHALLVGSIAPEERQGYLADVQIAQDIAGIAHRLTKTTRRMQQARASLQAEAPGNAPAPEWVPAPQTPDSAPSLDEHTALLEAIDALLSANTLDDLRPVLQQHPILLSLEADRAVEQLADVAVEQREYALAEGLHRARSLLDRMRVGADNLEELVEEIVAGPEANVAPPPTRSAEPSAPSDLPAASVAAPELPPEIYIALLEAESSEALHALVEQHPILLEPWVADALSRAVEEVVEDGHVRLAYSLEQRREFLAEVGQSSSASGPADAGGLADPHNQLAIEQAIEALLLAESEEALTDVVLAHPVLLTDEAQHALWRLSSEARTHGDEDLARYAAECRAMLRNVREGLSDA